MIAIIAAMEEELNEILKFTEKKIKNVIQGINFYSGEINGNKVVLCLSGIGKVNSAISTTILLENYKIQKVINIGSAGAIVGDIGDIVVAENTVYSDFDLTVFGYSFGQVPGRKPLFKSNDLLVDLTKSVLHKNNIKYHSGLIATADRFITKKIDLDAIAFEMEACSIAQVCDTYKKDFVVIRAISDVINGHNHVDFNEFLKEASVNSAFIVNEIIKEM